MAIASQSPTNSGPRSDHGPAVCVRIDLAMRMLGIGRTKLYELIATGELETIHIGRRTLVLQESIDSFVQRLRQQNTGGRD
jgi:excisionase family DNA binding protein